jgi:hypothetical protein
MRRISVSESLFAIDCTLAAMRSLPTCVIGDDPSRPSTSVHRPTITNTGPFGPSSGRVLNTTSNDGLYKRTRAFRAASRVWRGKLPFSKASITAGSIRISRNEPDALPRVRTILVSDRTPCHRLANAGGPVSGHSVSLAMLRLLTSPGCPARLSCAALRHAVASLGGT